jgi:hypothetical protein
MRTGGGEAAQAVAVGPLGGGGVGEIEDRKICAIRFLVAILHFFASSRLRAFAPSRAIIKPLPSCSRESGTGASREDAKGFLFARPSPKLRSFAEFRV